MNSRFFVLAVVLALFISSATTRDVQEMPELLTERATGTNILSIFEFSTSKIYIKLSVKVAQLR